MSHFSIAISPKGPILYVHIAISAPRLQALQTAGRQIPAPQLSEMLIDTGASHTAIDGKVVRALGLTPTGITQMLTPSTGTMPISAPTYDVAMVVPGIDGAQHIIGIHPVTECDFSAQGIDGLLGRDFLSGARLTYSGPDNFCYLSF